MRIVSLGCSLAHGITKLAAAGLNPYGVDVSQESITQAIDLGRGEHCHTEPASCRLQSTAGSCDVRSAPPCLQQSSLTQMPFADGWFEAGLSSDVLEHVHPDDVSAAVAEISRVVSSVLFLRISTVPEARKMKLNGKVLQLHLTVKPRAWWAEQFSAHGWREAPASYYPKTNKKVAFIMMVRGDGGARPPASSARTLRW